MKSARISAVALALLVGGSLALSGCAGSSTPASSPAATEDAQPALVDEAKAEGAVTWYTQLAEDRARVAADGFTAMYGIPVQIVRAPSATLMQRFTAERDAGAPVADLIDYSGVEPFRDAEEGDFLDIAEEGVPAAETWPDDAIIAGTAPRLSLDSFVIAYNTDLVSGDDIPKTWEDVFNPPISETVAHPKWDSSVLYLEVLQFLKDTYGEEFLEDFAKLDSTEYESGVPAMQAVAAGEHAALFPTGASFVIPLMESGAPVDFTVPSPAPGISVYAAVPFDGPHTKAGLLLLDYLMTVEGQQLLNEGVSVSALPDVPGTLELSEFVPVDRDEVIANQEELLALVSAR